MTPEDCGRVSANFGTTDSEKLCRFDVDGDGFVTASDRGAICANFNPLCTPLPDYMNGSGMNHGVVDSRFGSVGFFQGTGIDCSSFSCY